MWIGHKQLFVATVLSVEFLALSALTGQTKAHVIFFFFFFAILYSYEKRCKCVVFTTWSKV